MDRPHLTPASHTLAALYRCLRLWLSPLRFTDPLLLMQLPAGSFDTIFHIFFASHYAHHWFHPWNEKWLAGFSQRPISPAYPPMDCLFSKWLA